MEERLTLCRREGRAAGALIWEKSPSIVRFMRIFSKGVGGSQTAGRDALTSALPSLGILIPEFPSENMGRFWSNPCLEDFFGKVK